VVCSVNATIRCHDSTDTYDVTSVGYVSNNVTARFVHGSGGADGSGGTWLVGAATSRLQDGNVTGQDFTDNVLPASGEPSSPTTTAPAAAAPWARTWRLVVVLGGAVVAVGAGYRYWRG
jgi:hypothetical protein